MRGKVSVFVGTKVFLFYKDNFEIVYKEGWNREDLCKELKKKIKKDIDYKKLEERIFEEWRKVK